MYGKSNGAITFDLSDPEMSNSRPLILEGLSLNELDNMLLSKHRKGADLGHMLPLNTNRKSYTGSPMAPSHVSLSDFEGRN